MGYEVQIQDLPKDSWAFVCRDMATRLRQHNKTLDYFYRHFDVTRNPKQHQLHLVLTDPHLAARSNYRTQHICLRGGIGGGKSTMAFAWPLTVLHKHPGATWLVMLKTTKQIMGSVWAGMLKFFRKFKVPIRKKLPSQTGHAQIQLPNNSKFVFISSETVLSNSEEDNARGLGSMEFSGATIEEADIVPKEAIDTVVQRLREDSGVLLRVMFYILNPTPQDHWLPRLFRYKEDIEHPEDYHDFRFTIYDNAANLPPGYIDSVVARFRGNVALFRRFIMGEWGPSSKGIPIYGPYFRRDFHVSEKSFVNRWVSDHLWQDGPVILGFDFAYRHPAIVVWQDVQIGLFSQIRVLASFVGNNVTLGVFAGAKLPILKSLFPNAQFMTYGDPQGNNADPRGVSNINALDVLRKLGLAPVAIKTNESAGIELIIDLLRKVDTHKNLGVQPAISIEPGETLYAGESLTNDFIDMMETGFTQPTDLPKDVIKPINNYYTHIADAFRYGVVNRRYLRTPAEPIREFRDPRSEMLRTMAGAGVYIPAEELLSNEIEFGYNSATYNFGQIRGGYLRR